MKLVIVIDNINSEDPKYSTPAIFYEAWKRGHDVCLTDVSGFFHLPDGHMGAHVRVPKKKAIKDRVEMLNHLKSEECGKEKITSQEMDILMLRNDPTSEVGERAWAQHAGVIFGQIAVRDGVIVLNDPATLALALIDKMYFEHFPEIIKPPSIVSRDVEDIREFYKEHNRQIVLKPLQGSGGKDVFLLKEEDTNLNQIVEAISRYGYIIAQAYLPEAAKGDIRIIMMNGKLLEREGKVAAVRRMNKSGDFRSNMHAGGKATKVRVTQKMRKVAEIVGPKLMRDGIFLAGLDLVGEKLMEVNVLSPGVIINAAELLETDFVGLILDSMENKVYYRQLYGKTLSNKELNIIE